MLQLHQCLRNIGISHAAFGCRQVFRCISVIINRIFQLIVLSSQGAAVSGHLFQSPVNILDIEILRDIKILETESVQCGIDRIVDVDGAAVRISDQLNAVLLAAVQQAVSVKVGLPRNQVDLIL